MELTWKYATPVSIEEVEKVASENGVILPSYLIKIILKGNNGDPSRNVFTYGNGKEDIFKTLLSYRKSDVENIYRALKILKEDGVKIYPFGNDPGGNLICLDGEKVVLWNSETGTTVFISNNVIQFFENLR